MSKKIALPKSNTVSVRLTDDMLSGVKRKMVAMQRAAPNVTINQGDAIRELLALGLRAEKEART